MKTEVIHVRVSQSLKERITAVSQSAGVTVSDLVKQSLDTVLLGSGEDREEDGRITQLLERELATILD